MFYCNYTPVYSELYLGIPALLFDIFFALMLDLLLSSILLFGAAPSVSSEKSVEPTLQTLAELNAFPEDTRRRFTPFCVTGVVQAVSGPHVLASGDRCGRPRDPRHHPRTDRSSGYFTESDFRIMKPCLAFAGMGAMICVPSALTLRPAALNFTAPQFAVAAVRSAFVQTLMPSRT